MRWYDEQYLEALDCDNVYGVGLALVMLDRGAPRWELDCLWVHFHSLLDRERALDALAGAPL